MAVYTDIDNAGAYFNTVLYNGNGGTLAVTGVGFQPDLVWAKRRDDAANQVWFDAVRGVQKELHSNDTDAEATRSGVTAFGSDGFTLGSSDYANASSSTNVGWNWLESATSGFDIVAYTGSGSARTISHSLSAVPKMIIVKNRSAADAWQIYHGANTAAPETDYMVLNTNAATADAADRWNDTAPTSSVFSLGDGDEVNTNTENYIAYCFAEKQGFSKFGSYIGNDDADGAFIYTGFSPAFVFVKRTDAAESWFLYDNKRNAYVGNERYYVLRPNTGDAENTTYGDAWQMDFLSNGFKLRNAAGHLNSSSLVYAAFADAPLVNSNGVPCTAR